MTGSGETGKGTPLSSRAGTDDCPTCEKSAGCFRVRSGLGGGLQARKLTQLFIYGSFRCGKGTLVYADGSVYQGGFKNDKPHVFGRMVHANGNMYHSFRPPIRSS